MNTATANENRFPLPINNGPNREQLMDVFRMQYLEEGSRPHVELKLSRDFAGDGKDALHGALLRVEARVEFCPTSLQYEDGSGHSFNIGGYVSMNGNKGKSTVYMEGYYNAHARKGTLHPLSGTEYHDSWLKQYLDNGFLAKAEEWKERHKG